MDNLKTLSIRPNISIMSLLKDIEQYSNSLKRTDMISEAIEYATSSRVDWKHISKFKVTKYADLEIPSFIQVKIAEKDREDLILSIKTSFNEPVPLQRVTSPFLLKLVLINYLGYLQKKVTEYSNPIIAIIDGWITYRNNEPKCKYAGNEYVHDIFRALNDRDCVLTNGNVMADTIFSFWMPLKMVLECINKNDKFYKTDKYGNDESSYLKKIKQNIDVLLPKENPLVNELYKFATLAITRYNVMLLPDRQMQSRGKNFFDQMPKSLYECFNGGCYFSYFDNDEQNVKKWIISEGLDIFFENKDVQKSKIKPLVKRMVASEYEWLTDETELLEMLKNYNDILKERKNYLER